MPCSLVPNPQPDADQTAPPDEALKLQQPLPDGTLWIVVRVVKEDVGRAGRSWTANGPNLTTRCLCLRSRAA